LDVDPGADVASRFMGAHDAAFDRCKRLALAPWLGYRMSLHPMTVARAARMPANRDELPPQRRKNGGPIA
jgi:hypothetical protein